MKIPTWLRKLTIPRLLIEAALIFGSVYMALVLEADRSRDFEREIFIKELDRAVQEIKEDSVRLTRLRKAAIRYSKYDSITEQILISPNNELQLDTVFGYLRNGKIISGFYKEWYMAPEILESITLKEYLFLEMDFREYKDFTISRKRTIDYNLEIVNKIRDDLFVEIKKNYWFTGAALSQKDKREIVTSLYFKNAFSDAKLNNQFTPNACKVILKKSNKISLSIKKEITAQREAMKGIF